jgi:TonB family protein
MESFEADPAASQSVAALATPLGRYTQVALDLVNERWYDEDLPVEQRVAGVQGSVLVRFDVNRNGRVRGVKLMRRSGHAALDRMALRAVPSRLPAPPDDVDAPCRQQVAFRYINPFASID